MKPERYLSLRDQPDSAGTQTPRVAEVGLGLKTLWRGSVRVMISDAARTLIDMLALPATGGKIDHVADCMAAFLNMDTADRGLVIR